MVLHVEILGIHSQNDLKMKHKVGLLTLVSKLTIELQFSRQYGTGIRLSISINGIEFRVHK